MAGKRSTADRAGILVAAQLAERREAPAVSSSAIVLNLRRASIDAENLLSASAEKWVATRAAEDFERMNRAAKLANTIREALRACPGLGLAPVFVLASAAPAWAHHEVAIAEVVASWPIVVPALILAALGLIDRLRFWWRDGARMSARLDGWGACYVSRALTGAGWHLAGDRVLGVLDLGCPWFRVELYWRAR